MPEDNVEVQGGLPVSVGKTGAVSPMGKIALDPTQTSEILRNMQAMIDERTGPLAELSKGLEGASAWAVPSLGGQKAQALATVNEQQAKQAQELFNMRSQMAAYKASQAQAERFKQRAASQLRDGMTTTGGRINAEAQMPEQIRQALEAARQNNDEAAYDKIFNAWAQKQAEIYANPNMDEPKIPVVEKVGDKWVEKTISTREYRDNPDKYRDTPQTQAAVQSVMSTPTTTTSTGQQPVSVRNNNPGNIVDPKTGQIKTFATPEEGKAALDQEVSLKLSGQSQAVKDRFGDTGGFISPAMFAETWAPSAAKGNTLESTTNYAKAIAANLGIGPTDKIPNTAEAKKAVMDAITQFEAGTKPGNVTAAPATTAPAVEPTTAATTGPRPTPEALRKVSEVEQTGRLESAKEAGREVGKLAAEVVSVGRTAPEREIRSKDIVDLATDPELNKYIGMFAKKGTAPFVIRQIESGVNAGQFGVIGLADLKKNLTQAKAPPEVIAKLDRLEKNLNATQLEYAQTYLKGQGAVSDAERRLIASVVGNYVNNPAKFIEIQGRIMQERAQFDAKVAQAWGRYKDKHGTYAADFDQWQRSSEGQSLVAQHKKDLGAITGVDTSSIDNPFQVGAKPGEGGTTAAYKPGTVKWSINK